MSGTSGLRRQRSPWRTRLLAAVAAVAALAPALAPAGAQEPDPAEVDVDLELVDRSPWVAPGERADFALRADGPTTATTYDIAVHRALRSVEELEDSLEQNVGVRLYRSPRVPFEWMPLAGDGTRTVNLPTSSQGGDPALAPLRAPGVYPVVITLFAEDGRVLDVVRTPLVRLGTADDPLLAPTLALVVDVAVEPSLRPDGTRVVAADELDRLTGLGTMLAEHPAVPLTLAVVPDTIDALRVSPAPEAAAVLDALSPPPVDRRDGRSVVAMPYVPVSAAALGEAGLGDLLEDVLARGVSVLTDHFGHEPTVVVWDPRRDLDADAAERIVSLGYSRALLDAAVRDDGGEADPRPLVDAGPRPIEGLEPLVGILVDTETTDELTGAAHRADAGHITLADLILRDDEQESTVVVRVDDHDPGSILGRILTLAAREDTPVPVGGLDVVDAAPLLDADELTWTPAAAPDLGVLASRIPAIEVAIETYSDLLPDESSRPDDLRLQLLTSVAAGQDHEERVAALDAIDAALDATFDDVYLSGQTDLNLTSRQGTLPILVHNDNAFPVDVIVELRSDRLGFPQGARWDLTITDEVQRVDIPVEALATGSVPTFVQLRTPDGRVLLDARQLNVRSTAISGVGLALSVGALVVLIVWWARNWRRSRRARAMG